MKQYCTSEEDIETLFTYFQAAINGEENKESLKRLFDMQCGVMRSHSYQSERDKVLDEVLQLPQRREQPNGSMYIYVNDVKELRQKVGD